MIPVSKNNKNNGWIVNYQSYFNNSVEWWSEFLEKFLKSIILWTHPGKMKFLLVNG